MKKFEFFYCTVTGEIAENIFDLIRITWLDRKASFRHKWHIIWAGDELPDAKPADEVLPDIEKRIAGPTAITDEEEIARIEREVREFWESQADEELENEGFTIEETPEEDFSFTVFYEVYDYDGSFIAERTHDLIASSMDEAFEEAEIYLSEHYNTDSSYQIVEIQGSILAPWH